MVHSELRLPFSDHTLSVLREAGWSPARRIDPQSAVAALQQAGYTVFAPVHDFLVSFGELHLRYPIVTQRGRQLTSDMRLDPRQALPRLFREDIAAFEQIVGTELCVIGDGGHGHLTFMMDEHGRVFGGIEEWFAFYGETGAHAIEHVVTGTGIVAITH